MNWQDPDMIRGIGLLGATLLVSLGLWAMVRGAGRVSIRTAEGERPRLLPDLLHALAPPLQFAAWYYCFYFAVPLLLRFLYPEAADWMTRHRVMFWHLGLVVALFGCLFRAVDVIEAFLAVPIRKTPSALDDYLLKIGALALRIVIPLVGAVVLIHLLPLPPERLDRIDPFLRAAFIVAGAFLFYRAILNGEKAVLQGLDLKAADNFAARGVQTRVRILRKFAVVLNGMLAFAALLLLIPGVRALGASLLASAGMAGIVLGFAAQRSLATLFAGLQIALTQPIRLGDQVIVLSESGTIEEIVLTYVVVRTWDGRRLILPITYFIEQPFQNWTRLPTAMIATVKLRVDFSLPLAPVREAMQKWITAHPCWNKQTYAFQVTDADGATMELRVIAGVPNSGASFGMQCDVREKLITYIQEHYPECLPRNRQEAIPSAIPDPLAQSAPASQPARL